MSEGPGGVAGLGVDPLHPEGHPLLGDVDHIPRLGAVQPDVFPAAGDVIARGKDLARSPEDFDLFTVAGADDRFSREVWPWLRLAEHNLQAVLIRRPSDLPGLGLAWIAAELNASFNGGAAVEIEGHQSAGEVGAHVDPDGFKPGGIELGNQLQRFPGLVLPVRDQRSFARVARATWEQREVLVIVVQQFVDAFGPAERVVRV